MNPASVPVHGHKAHLDGFRLQNGVIKQLMLDFSPPIDLIGSLHANWHFCLHPSSKRSVPSEYISRLKVAYASRVCYATSCARILHLWLYNQKRWLTRHCSSLCVYSENLSFRMHRWAGSAGKPNTISTHNPVSAGKPSASRHIRADSNLVLTSCGSGSMSLQTLKCRHTDIAKAVFNRFCRGPPKLRCCLSGSMPRLSPRNRGFGNRI
jgi:hypothetical protein